MHCTDVTLPLGLSPHSPSTAVLRRLAVADAPAYRLLMLQAYEQHPDAFTSSAGERAALPMHWWEARLRASDVAPEVVIGAFSSAGALMGVAGVGFESREKTQHKSTLFGMFVAAEQRGRGLGALLVEGVLRYAHTRPAVTIMQLTVTEGNASAVRLYERCGFRAFGVEPYAVRLGEGFVAKVHMWRRVSEERRPRHPA